ncbi:MAG: aminotransferase class V-fold PLP-dependent enzyme [Actinomycetota bacterium]
MATWRLDPDVVHLNHGSFGACPVEVLDLQDQLRTEMEANPVAFMLRRYQPALEQNRTAMARFVGADPEGLVFVPNATYGVNSALRSVEGRLGPGDELVITSHTYNACRNAVANTAERTGARVVVADIPFPISSADEAVAAVLAALSDHTALLLVDHVTSPTGLRLPVEEILAAVDPSVITIVDGAHAPGMVDVDVATMGASFYTANCHKWLCAPKGAAMLWAAEPFRSTAVAASISHGYNDGWPGSGSRFHAQFDWTGTDDPTARLCVGLAIEVMGAHHPDGWPGIRSSNRTLALAGRRIVLEAIGAAEPAPASMIGSIASVPVPPERDPSDSIFDPLTTALHAEWSIEVPVFAWPESPQRLLRISAQQYNTVDDYRALAVAVAAELGRP